MGVDVIDFTVLQKRGILNKPLEERENDLIDFSKSISSPLSQTSSQSETSPLSFFDNVPSNQQSPALGNFFDVPTPVTSPLNSPVTPVLNSIEENSFKIKLDDFEYKMDRLLERIDKIESKIFDFKKNIKF